jgi:hypothetical protein
MLPQGHEHIRLCMLTETWCLRSAILLGADFAVCEVEVKTGFFHVENLSPLHCSDTFLRYQVTVYVWVCFWTLFCPTGPAS